MQIFEALKRLQQKIMYGCAYFENSLFLAMSKPFLFESVLVIHM